jgi:pyrroloquinoline-quinone synthase
MTLTRAHARVEGDHRRDAWRMVLEHTPEGIEARAVVAICQEAGTLWHAYRDGVADRMGLRGQAG